MTRRLAPLLPLVVVLVVGVGCDDDESETAEAPALRVPGYDTLPPAPPPTMPTGPTTFDPALRVPGHDPLPPPPMPQMPPGMAPGQMPPGMAPGQMPPGQGVPGAPISLAAGFTPDPHVAQGMPGGPVNAQTMAQGCAGMIASAPNHTLQLTTQFANLKILVSSQMDTTLVVRAPNGSFLCNDDGDALNPVVQGPFAPGVYSVWVGTYSQGQPPAPYVIGFTELAHVTAAALGGGGAPQMMQPTP